MRQYIGQRLVKLNSDLMTREPDPRGPQHTPLPHLKFFRVVQKQIKQLSLSTSDTVHSVSANGDQYFGMSMLDTKDKCFAPIVGWHNAHNQRSSITLYSGAGFFETDSLCMSGKVMIPMRQTPSFADKLPPIVRSSLTQLLQKNRQQAGTYRSFKSTLITEAEAEHAIIDMIRTGVINVKRVEHVISQWDYPDDQALRKRKTVWRLFCAVASSYKPVTSTDAISTLIDRSPRLMDYCKDMIINKSEI